MEIEEYIQQKPEGLKNLGAIVWLLNSVEGLLITNITLFFCGGAGGNVHKLMVLNRALFDPKIFSTLESKRVLFSKIIKKLSEVAADKGIDFDEQKWKEICKAISAAQQIRNDLAHNFLRFSDDGKEVTYIDLKGEKQTVINLEIELKNMNKIRSQLQSLVIEFFEQAQVILS